MAAVKSFRKSITGKIVLIIAIPLLALSLFLANCLVDKYQSLSELEDPEKISEQKRSMVIFSSLLISVIIGTTILGFFTIRSITDPLDKLYLAAKGMGDGKLDVHVDIKTGDRLEELGEMFNRTVAVLGKIKDEQKEIDSAKTKFISITSHELRSPMTPMKAQLQMLMGGYFGKLNQKQKDSLELIIRNTDHLDQIIVDFLEVSRIEAARLKFDFKRTNLVKTVKDLIEEMKGFMQEKKINLVLDFNGSKIPIIECDPSRLGQIIRNLINNAIKFSETGKTIKVKISPKKYYVQFSVTDQGIGISSDNQRRIFEPFFQAEQTIYRKKGGTGLGLAICRGIVESQNGKMWVESVVGKGSTFHFTIPLTPVRDIKPIKLLFSSEKFVIEKVKSVFQEELGPIGLTEFEELVSAGRITKAGLIEYLNSLKEKDVLDSDKAKVFKSRIESILSGTE